MTGVDLSKSSESFHWAKPVSRLSNLILLQLSNCNISGRIPIGQLLNLTSLSVVDMHSNILTSTILDMLSNITTLSALDFSGNNLDGHIPYLPQLEHLYVSSNLAMTINLVSMFSASWAKLKLMDARSKGLYLLQLQKKLRSLTLNDNNITGSCVHVQFDQPPILISDPEWFTRLPKLSYLSVNKNNRNGNVPLSLLQKSRLDLISFGINGLSVENDDQYQHAVQSFQPKVLDLSNNSLSGTIPHSLGNCKSLIYLSLGQNMLTGSVPEELERITSLRYLDLNGNEFEGSFPTVIEKFQELEILNLAGNRFKGRIPKFIGDLHHLRILVLASNSFNESIPEGVMKLENLQFISLSRNKLSGTIPENFEGLKKMTKTQNQTTILGYYYSLKFTGAQLEIVTKGQARFHVSVYSYNTGFDVSSNALSGKIPEKIGLLNGIPFLNLSHNNLTGLIPQTMGEMISLQSLDLCYNHFTGEIPVTLTLLNFLAYLNLSYNNLSGRIPTNPQFDTLYQDGTAYIGNKYLCGTPDGMNCRKNYRPSTNETKENRYVQENVLFVLVIFSGFATGISGVFLLLYLIDDNWRNRYWRAVDKIVSKIVNCKL
ncbi:LRR receptor-like serine/threonine-protein kinase GSO1 [Capsicum annuum]|uniref:LRR receptor-like serine/threonine-protein kinase GSO1 n=1 Tax=Capsicum annuum TaxID=4072 RepID=UPI001FB14C2A|nr:LRR receptor-like serine/threonine-protein kinase GSO1 [Capsicum annuum]